MNGMAACGLVLYVDRALASLARYPAKERLPLLTVYVQRLEVALREYPQLTEQGEPALKQVRAALDAAMMETEGGLWL